MPNGGTDEKTRILDARTAAEMVRFHLTDANRPKTSRHQAGLHEYVGRWS